LRVQSQQLPTESQVFEDEVRPATERTDQPAEEIPERHDHGKNFNGKDRIKLCAKSLISQVYDLLARHRLTAPEKGPDECFSNKTRIAGHFWKPWEQHCSTTMRSRKSSATQFVGPLA
jgi:hypothetical protein